MSKLLRYFEPGQTVFVTAITVDRQPLLSDNEDLLVLAFKEVFGRALSGLRAWVILPDHFHAIIETEHGDVPNMMRRIKLIFGSAYRSRHALFRATIWQRRYWDHIIRDERDLRNHIDYVHYNPVRHGYALSPFEHSHSSARLYLDNGVYESDWGSSQSLEFRGEFGE